MLAISIIGGGPVGLCLATGLAQKGHTVTLFEKQPHARLAEPEYDGREIAITHGSQAVLQKWGIWQRLAQQALPTIRHANVVDGESPFALQFASTDTYLGTIISNQRIRQAAWDAAIAQPNITLRTGAEVRAIETDKQAVTLHLADGSEHRADLVIAADSRFSPTRHMMGIATETHDLGRICLVCTMLIEGEHADTATEMFLYGQTLAILPLGRGRISVVLTADKTRAQQFLTLLPDDFNARIMELTQEKYGAMQLDSDLFSYPLTTSFAARFHAERYALVGDAAVGMHPVTAHGFNLGLRGAATLIRSLDAAPVLQQALQHYSTTHRRACRPLYHMTNQLVALYTNERLPSKLARAAFLRAAEKVTPLKRFMMQKLTDRYAA